MRYLYFFFIAFVSLQVNGQSSSSGNFINVGFSPKYYFNKNYVDNNDISPNPFKVKNTYGYSFGIAYERITKYNLILTVGMDYGALHHDIHLVQDLSDFDPNATKSLNGIVYDRKIYVNLKYLSPRFLIGYRMPVASEWAVVGKVGLSVSLFLRGFGSPGTGYSIDYTRDDGTQMGNVRFMAEQISLGEDANHKGITKFTYPVHTYECYLGAERIIKKHWVKKLSIGIEGRRAINWNNPPGFVQVSSIGKISDAANNIDWYKDRNMSIGLRIRMGLWK